MGNVFKHNRPSDLTLLSKLFRIIPVIFIVMTFSSFLSCALSQDLKSLSAEELKKMIDEGVKMSIVDTRNENEYIEGHIPHAILIPQEKFDVIETLLPKDKDMPIVFYCRGYG